MRSSKQPLKWKYGNLRFLLLSLYFFTSIVTFAQINVGGRVVDTTGETLIGVNVIIKGSSQGTVSDINGEFSLQVPSSNSTLVFSYVGFVEQEIPLNGRTYLNITMEQDTEILDEVIVVGYGTQRRTSVTGAVSTLSNTELIKAPVVGVTNVLGARVAGVTMLQQTGQPGQDAASLLVRGEGATYIVDGVIRSINEIDPNEIESISILKDATSASVYGLNATSVIIVTTKRGKEGQLGISYNGSYGISQNANQIKWLDGPGYAYWYNRARELDGDEPVFTSAQIEKMISGTDGWGNTNWYDEVFGVGSTMNHNVSATGGTDKVKFFSSISAFQQKGNVDNFDYSRYNLRANIDSKITDNITLVMNIAGRLDEHNRPSYSANPNDWHNIPQQAVRALPYLPKTTIGADGREYYVSTRTASSPVSPVAAIYESGYSRPRNTTIQTNFSLNYDAPWMEGLSLKFMGAYDKFFQFNKSLIIPYQTMIGSLPNSSTEKIDYVSFFNNSGNTSLSESGHSATSVVTQSSFTYDKAFDNHKINVFGLAETRNNYSNTLGATGYGLDFLELAELSKITNTTGNGEERIPTISGSSAQSRLIGFVGRVNYDYDERYLLEASIRRDGSYLFSGMTGSQWVNLPAISAGWRMNNEEWFVAHWIDNLKIRGGIGKTATSAVNAFQYLNLMTLSSNALILGDQRQSMLYTATLGNPNLTWAKAITYNLGVEFMAWRGLLGVEVDAFYKYQYDLLASIGGSYPPSMGGYFFNSDNVNKIDYRGFDFTISHNNKIGDFTYGVKWVGTLAYRRWLYYAGDSENTPDYRKLTGKEVGSQLGFIAEGLFQSQEEINNSPTITGSPVLPGYIKYKDRNGDGKITYAQDMGYVGKSPYSRFQTSLNLNGSWKGFDFDILFQSGLGRTVALTGVYTSTGSEGIMDNTAFTKLFYHGGNSPQFLPENSWTPDNTNAEFPRLSLVNVSTNNAYSSTFWYRNGNYLRLKSFQIGYTIPQSFTRSAGIDRIRLYVEGSNILTFSELTKYNIDPESPGVNNGYYPQQRTLSFGLNFSL
ncbi:SusC/RagA family TonB-linked outer membrane protein [Proteiniphilum saccharofermentans]|uniref:SusC/RagA family TonB-linked outer membrane protein n=1 Tax=Proteiniphilum saccharofermentans TaxID=1642647 RepID=A0A1R3T708_9BACT|nr:TonB-dependent receptor [Proteiniphilum saccharofermentans]SCD21879.1 SusC/RagA family TonB-linked outer membrane protein [Proteiniphilum saccharofermentans]